jgi:hypothetical protein
MGRDNLGELVVDERINIKIDFIECDRSVD